MSGGVGRALAIGGWGWVPPGGAHAGGNGRRGVAGGGIFGAPRGQIGGGSRSKR